MDQKKKIQALMEKQSRQLQKSLSGLKDFHAQIFAVAEHVSAAFYNGKKAYVAGNGGSAAQAQHLSDEMLGRYKSNRPPYPLMALTADGAVLTCIGNDFGFEQIFSRQIAALGREGDVFIALSTSGNSANILAAAKTAREHGMTVIAMTGLAGELKKVADFVIAAPAKETARIQELHLHAIHLLCEILEDPAALPKNFSEQT